MGFRFRKSVAFGPLRVNLSGSGVGASVGVPGFRIGVNARGQSYLQAGGHGVYYRTGLRHGGGSDSLPTPAPSVLPSPVTTPASRTHGPMMAHGSAHAGSQQDELTEAVSRAVLHTSYVPWAVILILAAAVSLVLVIANGQADAATAFLVLLSFLGVGAGVFMLRAALERDRRVRVELNYQLDQESRDEWDRFCSAVASLGSSGVKLLRGGAQVYDPKYHGGAGRLVETGPVKVEASHRLQGVVCAITTPAVEPIRGTTYVFLPDRVACIRDGTFSRLRYDELRFETSTTSIIEDRAPAGADVIGHTWQYTNKSGGPDRRFRDNRQLPIVEYALVRMTTAGGMDHAILFVSKPLATSFVESLTRLSAWEASYDRIQPTPVALPAPDEVNATAQIPGDSDRCGGSGDPPKRSEPDAEYGHDDPFDSVLDALCCVMFADGSCSRAERETIVGVLKRLKAPRTEQQVIDHMKRRWQDVKDRGFDAVLTETSAGLGNLRTERQQTVLRKCLQEVARSDGRLAESEKSVYHRLLAMLPSATAASPTR